MKTIKQIADELGIDKQKVYRYVRKNNIIDVLQEAGTMYYDDSDADSIIAHFLQGNHIKESHQEAHQNDIVDTLIFMLQRELENKNEQISELNARLAESNAALVTAQQSAQAAQALHAGTIQKQLSEGRGVAAQSPAGEKTKGFFSKWFKK